MLLLGEYAKAALEDHSGRTPLSYALERENWDIIEPLLERNGELNQVVTLLVDLCFHTLARRSVHDL